MTLTPIQYNDVTVIVHIPETPDHISEKWKNGSFYEAHATGMLPRVHELMERYRYKTAIDVGAHWGNHSLFFAAVMEMDVVAFEPRKESYDLLYANTKGQNVSCHRIVMGNTDFDRYREIEGPEGNTGMTRYKKMYAAQINANPENRGTAGSRLDFILPQIKKDLSQLALIKIDVEGFEDEVLKGAEKLIAKHSPDLWIETEIPELILKQLNQKRHEHKHYKLEGPYNHTATWRYYVKHPRSTKD